MRQLGRLFRSYSVKPHFTTTPIFYVNAKPHIGHLHAMVLADSVHRWKLFTKTPSILSTGTDEHGSKVAQAAAKNHAAIKPFVDNLSGSFLSLAKTANIDYTRFVRTTDPDHIEQAREFWRILVRNGHIYRGQHKGWYCISDETFYPESELEKQPDGTFISIESRNPVEWYEEDNWFFRLSSFQNQLIDHFESTPGFVVPQTRQKSLLHALKTQPLEDLSISRPKTRCDWGIEVPDDPSQVMYVWFEALINYYTVSRSLEPRFGTSWPADLHIVGKDIVRFHSIYWPAFLMAAGLQIPSKIAVHSHWTLEGFKMSKSKNNVVDPIDTINSYGLDTVRYFLMHDSMLERDTPFSYERVVERHNVNLVNKLGNLISRVCGPKFDIPAALEAQSAGLLPTGDGESPANHTKLVQLLGGLLPKADGHMDACEPNRVLQHINDIAMLANQYFQDAAPWSADSATKNLVVATSADVCRVLSLTLQPFCPEYGARMLDRLAVAPEKRTSDYISLGSDPSFGVGANRKGDPVLTRIGPTSE